MLKAGSQRSFSLCYLPANCDTLRAPEKNKKSENDL